MCSHVCQRVKFVSGSKHGPWLCSVQDVRADPAIQGRARAGSILVWPTGQIIIDSKSIRANGPLLQKCRVLLDRKVLSVPVLKACLKDVEMFFLSDIPNGFEYKAASPHAKAIKKLLKCLRRLRLRSSSQRDPDVNDLAVPWHV